jgi:hypothetical protein
MYLVPMTVGSGRRSRTMLVEHRGRVRCPGLGASSDIVSGMISEGYDPTLVSGLSIAGATDAQLQSLWDNYQPTDPGFWTAAYNLANSLTINLRPSAAGQQPAQQPRPVALQTSVSWWDQSSPLGIQNKYAVGIGGGLVLILLLRRRR